MDSSTTFTALPYIFFPAPLNFFKLFASLFWISHFLLLWSKMFKGSAHYTSTGRYPRVIGEENMALRSPRRPTYRNDQSKAEKEEIDHAIALSLAEDARKPKFVPLGYKIQADTDEGLSRALQESLNMSSFRPYAPTRSSPGGYRICKGCNSDLSYGRYLSCMGAFWHPQCFRCHACENPISESEFSLSGTDPYHRSCYKKMHHPKCDVCQQCIPTNGAGLIEYKTHPFWHQKCCPSHDRDNTPRCCSCERMESRNAKYISLGDGRSLCLECLDSAIMDTGDCQPLYHSIRDYFEGMNLKLDQQIPILLVERQALNEAIEGEKYGHRHTSETRGLCLSEEQTVRTIFTRPRIGGNSIIDMRTYPQKLTRKSEVTAILILYGLPRLLTGSILAHELMHGWFRLNGYCNIRPEVEEGICQVLSHMWLESEMMMPGSGKMPSSSSIATSSLFHHSSSSPSSSKKTKGKSDMERKLGEFFLHHISHDSSLVYGEGFRAANAAVKRYGLRPTLDHIRLTGYLPF